MLIPPNKSDNVSFNAKETAKPPTPRAVIKGVIEIPKDWRINNIPIEKIEIIIHPQSIIHSLVEFVDGSIKAQLGIPDMKIPIQYVLSYPNRENILWDGLYVDDGDSCRAFRRIRARILVVSLDFKYD